MDYSYSYSAEMTNNPALVVVYLIIAVVSIVALWRVFTKAGRPGWAAIIPIYNIYTLVKVSGNSGWFTLLYFVPIANIIVSILVALGVAKNFGKSAAFGIVGLWLFSIIGYLIIGFGSAQYVGEKPTA